MAESDLEPLHQEPEALANGVQKSAPKDTHHAPSGDPDAQAMVITSLRSQIQDLFSQVTQLNGKLVQSYDRVSDLEDDLHVASSNVRQSSVKISELELERTQHLAALNTGLLVERSHVTAELTRLMEKATEEAAQRGQAETAKADIEKDLDDLSATLFQQANTMVAEARFARAQSERKVEDAERALKGAEEAVAMMQQQMQDMEAQKENSEKRAEDMRAVMGKGKWVERTNGVPSPLVRLMSSHAPYQEFLLFVGHLRSTRTTSPTLPPMSTLLSLPFLARLVNEESEPTVRLDLAPSLNWLSRRSVLSAIHAGQLMIEPISSTTLLQEFSAQSSSGLPATVCCALCGTPIFPAELNSHSARLPAGPARTLSNLNANSWFKKPLTYSATSSANNSPPLSPRRSNSSIMPAPPQKQTYIFRLASTAPSATANLGVSMLPTAMTASYSSPSSSTNPQTLSPQPQQPNRNAPSTIYPLCSSGWCLTRLRSTCTLWAFVRAGVIDKVWEEELPVPPPSIPSKSAGADSKTDELSLGKPPLLPKKRGLWSMASVLSERAASWTESDKGRGNVPEKEAEKVEKIERRLPPPLPPRANDAAPPKTGALPPPPPPRRAVGRARSATVSRGASPAPNPTQAIPQVVEEEEKESTGNEDSAHAEEGEGHASAEEMSTLASAETIFHAGDAHEHDDDDAGPPSPTTDKPGHITISPLGTPSEKRKSQDSFTSAASEIVSTPTSPPVPLPAPQTPPPAPAPIPALVSPKPHFPATPPRTRVTSMAPSTPKRPLTPTRPDTPPRTGSPAPPPLPRRAAARARPVSVVLAAPPTPPPALPSVPEPEPEPKVVKEVPVAPVEEVTTPVAPATPIPSEPLPEPVPAETEKAAPPTAETEPTSLAAEVAPDATDAPPSPTPTILPDSRRFSTEPAEEASTPKPSEEVGEGYIGDATWEEKTWRELVKLKEDMFWARVGGVR